MDLGTGELKQDAIPLHRQIHIVGRTIGPDGKLYLATPDRKNPGMDVFVYDPATNELSNKGIVVPRLGGEKRSMCVGTDGKVYGSGSYRPESKVGAYQIDPATGKVTDYGIIGQPGLGGRIAFSGDDLYLGAGTTLRVVRGMTKGL